MFGERSIRDGVEISLNWSRCVDAVLDFCHLSFVDGGEEENIRKISEVHWAGLRQQQQQGSFLLRRRYRLPRQRHDRPSIGIVASSKAMHAVLHIQSF